MTHIFLRTILAVTVSASLLTACNKADTPKTDASKGETTKASSSVSVSTPTATSATVTTTATSTTTTTTLATTKSPTVDMYVTSFKMATAGMLNAKKPLTKEQTTCLLSKDSDATYYADVQKDLNTIMGADGVAESDKFYETEVGKKMLTYITQQQAKAMGQPITGAPVVITDADKKAAADFTTSNPKMKEIETKMKASMENPQTMMTKIQKYTTQEQARCHIS